MKTILVHADLGKAFSSRIAFAVRQAKKHNSRLQGLYVIPLFQMAGYSKYTFPKEVLEARVAAEQEEANFAKAVFDQAVEGANIESSWSVETGDLVDTLCGVARTSNMLIMGQRDTSDLKLVDGVSPDRVILRAGRPVLVTPHVEFDERAGSHVMVAWDGSRESARALHDALPLLIKAEQVDIVTFSEKKSKAAGVASLESVTAFLIEYGVKVNGETLMLDELGVGDALLNRVVDRGANMLVMGGYGRSRLREVVLGGVTRTILDHCSIPVMMSR